MSSPTDSGDLDEPAEANKVENVEENSDCLQDPTVAPQKASAILVSVDSVVEGGEVIHQDEGLPDEALTVDQQSTQVDKQAFDQTGARDVDDSRSSQLEGKTNDCELERDTPIQDHSKDQQLSEVVAVADQSLHLNVGDSDSRPENSKEKSNAPELDRDIPMESEDNYSGGLYDFLNFILFTMLLTYCKSEAKIGVVCTLLRGEGVFRLVWCLNLKL